MHRGQGCQVLSFGHLSQMQPLHVAEELRTEWEPSGGLWPRGRREKGLRTALAGYLWGCGWSTEMLPGRRLDAWLFRGKPASLLQHGRSDEETVHGFKAFIVERQREGEV